MSEESNLTIDLYNEKEGIKRIKKIVKSHGKKSHIKRTTLKKLLKCYRMGFKCYYCNKRMEISFGSPDSFTVDHGIPRSHGGNSEYGNIFFACYGCNVLKGSIHMEHFKKIVSAIKEVHGDSFYDKIKRERSEKDLENRKGVYGHRPRKPIDTDYVIKHFNDDKTLKDIAKELGVSHVTLWKRLKEAGITLPTKSEELSEPPIKRVRRKEADSTRQALLDEWK